MELLIWNQATGEPPDSVTFVRSKTDKWSLLRPLVVMIVCQATPTKLGFSLLCAEGKLVVDFVCFNSI